MTHKMRLVNFAFEAIRNGTKDIEVRLNDDKRQLIKIGDMIEFTNLDTGEIIIVKVTNLYKYESFKKLFDAFPRSRLGINDNDTETIMNQFYTLEEQRKYGAIGIEIKVIK